jgi:hypothetical protein
MMVQQSCPATQHVGTFGERSYRSNSFLTSVLDGGEQSASSPGNCTCLIPKLNMSVNILNH